MNKKTFLEKTYVVINNKNENADRFQSFKMGTSEQF